MRVQQMLDDPKIAVGVTTATAVTGIGSMLDLITGVAGIIATSITIVLGCVLIVTHLRKSRLDSRKTLLEIKELEARSGKNSSATKV